MEQITLYRDGKRNLRFVGELIREESTRGIDDNRWTELSLYVTKGGRYVAARSRISQWQGEEDFFEAESFGSARELQEWLGWSEEAKALYDAADIAAYEEVE